MEGEVAHKRIRGKKRGGGKLTEESNDREGGREEYQQTRRKGVGG